MIKIKHKSFNGLDIKHRGKFSRCTWTLCVGAGISFGLVPTWQELTRKVLNEAFGTQYDQDTFEILVSTTRWNLDALLQGAYNQLNLSGEHDQFENLLEKALYDELLSKLDQLKLGQPLRSALNNPRNLKKDEINRLTEFFDSQHSNSTLVQLAKKLSKAKEAEKAPEAIINFNADTLLFALLDLYLIREHAKKINKWEQPTYSFIKALRGIDGLPHGATPIFHCHGAVAPLPEKTRRRDSREHLVFTEAHYLNIAGNIATWAQSLFLFYAQNSKLIIIGHSLADSNIRKWLAWSSNSSLEEMTAISGSTEISPRHIWITLRNQDENICKIQEISLLHLGVQICWVTSWNDVGDVLENLLAL